MNIIEVFPFYGKLNNKINTAYTNGGASSDVGGAGDADLTALAGYPTYDAVDLTFSFTTPDSNVFFNYVFASTEYFTYVNTQYNDAFGFFLDGVNLALVPGTNTPVAVNNVNAYLYPVARFKA